MHGWMDGGREAWRDGCMYVGMYRMYTPYDIHIMHACEHLCTYMHIDLFRHL